MTRPASASPDRPSQSETRIGVAFGLGAYLWWGFIALYFKAVARVAPAEVLAHRTLWSFLLLGLWLKLRPPKEGVLSPLRHRPTALVLLATTVLIASNWYLYIWAITNHQLVQASLGYFINPLVNVLLGTLFLRERLRPLQLMAVALAAVGVAWRTIALGDLPLISLALAFSFGFYGLLRKQTRLSGTTGLFLEVALLSPFALGYLGWLARDGKLSFLCLDRTTDLLLMAAGVITALPLLWFLEAARRLPLSTMGFLQFLSPTFQLLIAVVLFGEPFPIAARWSFVWIWIGLILFSIDSWRAARAYRLLAQRPQINA